MKGKQYTIRGISEQLDHALREEAARYGKSLNALLIDKLSDSCKLSPERKTNGLEKFAGCMEPDPDFDAAIKEFDRVDAELDDWR
ncbi:hypothetical protein JIN85_11100 [Luteolibacter pohnpeiensis]|uniref:Arc-like DNA binding domain-containing protein n=1 Tax=Luteolibacter pohnpeiensis TaxID=454153 RepID=A0A934VW66_9BACT|nr:hypothetical protein [Luteolibacter pohnpeiensis]MBK1882965.1 hypothetical protein [Luteolibacter pohnpeiensis]